MKRISIAAAVLALAASTLALAGCDKCNDFFAPAKSENAGAPVTCKDAAPRPH